MVVLADRETCIGAGTCVDTAPEVFELDETGIVCILQPRFDSDLLDAVEDAVAMCPVEALRFED